jgi:hypothetical protein
VARFQSSDVHQAQTCTKLRRAPSSDVHHASDVHIGRHTIRAHTLHQDGEQRPSVAIVVCDSCNKLLVSEKAHALFPYSNHLGPVESKRIQVVVSDSVVNYHTMASVSSNVSTVRAPRVHAVRVVTAPPRLGSSMTKESEAAATRRVHFSPNVTIVESVGQAEETVEPITPATGRVHFSSNVMIVENAGQDKEAMNGESNINSMLESRPTRARQLRYFDVIVDTGCSHSCTPCIDDFIAGTLKPYHATVSGIADELKITHRGVVHYELLDDNFNIVAIETSAFLVPAMKERLFSPQACLQEVRSKPFTRNDKFTVHMTADSMEFRWLNGCGLTVHYRPPGALPRFRVFRDAHFIAKHLARTLLRTKMSAERRKLLHWHMHGVLVDKIARGLPKRFFHLLRDHRF